MKDYRKAYQSEVAKKASATRKRRKTATKAAATRKRNAGGVKLT